jgi:hypothetical protein
MVLGRVAVQPLKEKQASKSSLKTKGIVSDDTGLPLPGANIIIKGTATGTQTDFNGNYEIETQAGDVLVFSYLGFETKEITVSNISNTINLELSSAVMGELATVVVGGISFEDYEAWREKIKKASDNIRAFEKIKRERKRAARKNK